MRTALLLDLDHREAIDALARRSLKPPAKGVLKRFMFISYHRRGQSGGHWAWPSHLMFSDHKIPKWFAGKIDGRYSTYQISDF